MQIEGRVIQVILPEDHKSFFGDYFREQIVGKNAIVITSLDAPDDKNVFVRMMKRIRYFIRNHRYPKAWHIFSGKKFNVGEVVAVDIQPYLPLVEYWTC